MVLGRPEFVPFKSSLTFSLIYPPPNRPFLSLRGFKTCSCLDGSTFFTDMPLQLPSGATQLNASTALLVVDNIDAQADHFIRELGKGVLRSYQYGDGLKLDHVQRGICFTVALGNVDNWGAFVGGQDNTDNTTQIIRERFLRTVNADVALDFLQYTPPESSQLAVPKPQYKLAYLLLVHRGFENILALINALDDPSVFIYIHIDHLAPASFRTEIEWLANKRPNVAIMDFSFTISWGHISILWAQIRGYFSLLDLIDFEYVINLSAFDYPLKSANTIFNHLERKPGSSWIDWVESLESNKRMETIHFGLPDSRNGRTRIRGFNQRGWSAMQDLFPALYKASQWMILHRSAVQYLRTSEAGKLLVMWAENTWVPDEEVFGTFFSSTPFVDNIVQDNKRIIWWDGRSDHPHVFIHKDAEVIRRLEGHFLWIRKADVVRDRDLKDMLDNIREVDEMSDRIVAPNRHPW